MAELLPALCGFLRSVGGSRGGAGVQPPRAQLPLPASASCTPYSARERNPLGMRAPHAIRKRAHAQSRTARAQ